MPKSKDEDAENDEIEWLEYMLKKEKGKGKAEDLEDGLNGASASSSGGK